MKKFFVFAALAAFALTSCEQKIDVPAVIPTPGGSESTGLVFTATTESSATKTALDDNYNVLWQNGDMITILDGDSHVGVYSTTSTTTQGVFTHSSGDEAGTSPYTAYYPSTIYKGGTLTLPAEQTYVAENISGAPMMAVSSTTSLGFKNLVGIIKLSLTTNQSGQKVRSIALSANEGMSGPFTVTSDAAVVSGTAGVTLDCGTEGVAIGTTAIPFYIAVPANTYTGLSITVTTTTGAYQTFTLKSDKSIVVGRSQITDINLSANNILYDLPGDYTAVEYLESTGTQYIDTGVPCNWQDFVDIDFMYTGTEPGNVHPTEGGSVFGAHGWSKANGIYEKCIYWRGFGKIAYNFAIGTRYNVKTVDGTHSSINGVTYQIDVTGSVGVAPSNFALFANYSDYNNQGWTYFSVARIYSCKLYDSNHVWLRYFVPCVRTSDGKPGMYDRVNDVFYVNGGSGEFGTNLTPAVTAYDLTAGDVAVQAGEVATVTGSNANSVLTIGAGATVTLQNATLKQIVTQGDATLILSGTNTQTTEFTGAAIHIADNATLTIDGTGRLDVDRGRSSDYGCIFGTNANLVVNGGTMKLVSNKGAGNKTCAAINLNNYTQNGGSVEAYGEFDNNDANSYANGMQISNDVLITGGTLRTEGATGLWVGNNISISGGTVTAIGTYRQYSGSTGIVPGGNNTGGKLTISGGTVRAEGNGGSGGQGPGIGRRTAACGDIIISGGDVTVSSTGNGVPGGAAAIGTGTDAVAIGCNITITSGITRLVVTKGVNAQAPIGKGNANSSVGTITIDDGLQIVSSNNGNTWTIEADTYNPTSLSDLKSMINEGVICNKYIGRYVYSDGSIGTDATAAIGRMAYVSTQGVDYRGIEGARMLVVALNDIRPGGYDNCDDAQAAATNLGLAIAGQSQTQWRIPTSGMWNDMTFGLGKDGTHENGDFYVLCSALGLGTSSYYWTTTKETNSPYRYYYCYATSWDYSANRLYFNFATIPAAQARACFAY